MHETTQDASDLKATPGMTGVEGKVLGMDGEEVHAFVFFNASDDLIRFGMHGVACAVLPLRDFLRLDRLKLVTLGWDFITAENMASWLQELAKKLQSVQPRLLAIKDEQSMVTARKGKRKTTTKKNDGQE